MANVPEVSVVVPCYNEEALLAETHKRLTQVLGECTSDYELVYVNDGSSDGTMTVLRELYRQDSHVKLVSLSRNFGHQLAVSAGLQHARGRAVVIIDADMQDPPETISRMLEKWREGFDVVYGVRNSREGETWFKLWSARLFYRVINGVSDTAIPLDTGDFRLLSRRVVDVLISMGETHRLLRGMTSWIGFRQCGIEYARAARAAGKTKYPLAKMVKLALDGILSFSTLPLHLVSLLGLFSAGLAVAGMVWAFVVRIFTQEWVPGWTSIFIGMLFLGGIQLISLGVLGEYIGRIYTEAKRRPLFVVQEVLDRSAVEPGAAYSTARQNR